jgi:hypothetical protein
VQRGTLFSCLRLSRARARAIATAIAIAGAGAGAGNSSSSCEHFLLMNKKHKTQREERFYQEKGKSGLYKLQPIPFVDLC